jgi:ribonuclease VapC
VIAVDTSALIAIANAEPVADVFAEMIGRASTLVSTATLLEAHSVSMRWVGGTQPDKLQAILEQLELTVVPLDMVQLEAARAAYSQYGRGRGHRADLNMGDCFSYALAKTRRLPLLFKGDDFIHTDIEPALKPA